MWGCRLKNLEILSNEDIPSRLPKTGINLDLKFFPPFVGISLFGPKKIRQHSPFLLPPFYPL